MRKVLLLLLTGIGLFVCAEGQTSRIDSLRSAYDQLYGLDVILNNGKKFFPDNNRVKGHPYWRNQQVFPARLTVAGKMFPDQYVKYDLYKQEFILAYQDYNGQPQQIILNSEVIDTVRTVNACFVRNKFQEIPEPFVQLIHQGQLICLISWSKELQFNRTGANTGYEYTREEPAYYLVWGDKVYRFSSKSTFINIFQKGKRSSIKKYLKSQHFRFKHIGDDALKQLVIYCEESVL